MDILLYPDALAAAGCGFVIGWLICFTGVGGGVLVVPALAFFFSLPVSSAIGTASAYAALTKLLAGAEHARIDNINYGLFLRLGGWALPGLLVAAAAVHYFLAAHPQWEHVTQAALRYAVIAAILLALALTLRQPAPPADAPPRRPRRAKLAAAGMTIGAVMGATGVGGGVLIAPALFLMGKETPKRVVGTSILTALALSALTAALYGASGHLDWGLALWMTFGSFLAIPIASRALRFASENVVKKSVIALIALAALLMLAGGG